MEIPQKLLDTLDPCLKPVYVELYDEYALVLFDHDFYMLRPFGKSESGGVIFESVFEPIYFRRN
jgi:hypothetical protein